MFLSIVNKYVLGRLALMVQTGAGGKTIFCQVEQIQIEDIQVQAFLYFGLLGIGNVNSALTNPLVLSALKNLANNQQKIQNFHDRVRSDIIDKTIDG